ncbi:MAG TPA: helix-turn-helix domain-containing protein [Propionicimonas sp.]|jgi:AcrR family transcriptional regulator|uniref:TetR/AcrR family transcriptional regulator n=1 Tax=Propionicimonas sp. TaxID=1955623 RepID=UPI002F3E607D
MRLTPRQAGFADAALRLLARHGMAAVTFRTVAAEAGMSLGAVQKAFPTKDVMLRVMFARLRDSSAGPAPRGPGGPTVEAWLVERMMSLLPLDAARRAAELQRVSFAERAAFDPAIAAAVAASDHELRVALADMMRDAQANGQLPSSVDPDAAAWAARAFVKGMASQLLYDPAPEYAVRRQCQWVVKTLLQRAISYDTSTAGPEAGSPASGTPASTSSGRCR